MKRDHEVVLWAGDFNQSVEGPNAGGSKTGRHGLVNALADLGFEALNGAADHAIPSLKTIDFICGPRALPVQAVGRIEPVREGVKMSDHAGYWIDIDW